MRKLLLADCPKHPDCTLSKKHVIQCLDMNRRLQMPATIKNPLSFLLDLLVTLKPRSFQFTSS